MIDRKRVRGIERKRERKKGEELIQEKEMIKESNEHTEKDKERESRKVYVDKGDKKRKLVCVRDRQTKREWGGGDMATIGCTWRKSHCKDDSIKNLLQPY